MTPAKRWLFRGILGILFLLTFFFVVTTTKNPKLGERPDVAADTASLPPSLRDQLREGKKPNRLIREKSPYLLQHAFNPVDWYPWGEEAFEKARREDKPIFLSIGYSTCYWCHVMEREVFEDTSIARLMNESLVCIKVDREERPDIDRVYMTAVQAMTGSGGWPMSVFLDSALTPFFGATYIPPRAQYGRPGFPDIVRRISEVWTKDRSKIHESSAQIGEFLRNSASPAPASVNDSALTEAFSTFSRAFDPEFGGFGSAPKFPRPVVFDFLLRFYYRTGEDSALRMVLLTLRKMSEGGVYDQLGGGFHRYSVDGQWRVPHFEKMLYDQAGLAISYLEAYQITRDPLYSAVAREVLDYVSENMTGPEGGFYSAEDAESAVDPARGSEKEEGAFYLWTMRELEALLGKEHSALFAFRYGASDSGNALDDPMHVFTGKNILYAARTVEETAAKFGTSPAQVRQILADARRSLLQARNLRPRPHLDDKIITAWNGMMIGAYSRAYQVLHDPADLERARRSAGFVMSKLYDGGSGILRRRYRDGESRFEGTLQDYAFLIQGLIDLYESSFEIRWLKDAVALAKKQNETFWDPSAGGYFDASGKDPTVLIRTKEDYDGAEAAGNSVAALNLLRLSQMTDNKEFRSMADKTIASLGSRIRSSPEAVPEMLSALAWSVSTPREIVIAGNPGASDTESLLSEVYSHFIPFRVVMLADGRDGQRELTSLLPFIAGMSPVGGKATAFICENYACRLPTSDRATVARLLGDMGKGRDRLAHDRP